MRNFIMSLIFIVAVGCGLGVGYGVVKTTGYTYDFALGYISELRAETTFTETGLGGPLTEEITEQTIENATADQVSDSRSFYITNQNKTPKISSTSYAIADLKTGSIILSKNPNQQLPIASVTKLMTAVVADEALGLAHETKIDRTAVNTYGSQGNLKVGEKYSVSEILYPLLLESSNDAAEVLARSKNRTSFIADMNAKAQSIGLIKTEFEDASGLSYNNKSTVRELVKLAQYIDTYRKYIFEITTEKKKDLRNKTWFSNSRFRSDSKYLGGKNGYTDEALKTQLALFEHEFNGEKRTLVYVLLRSNDIAYDMKLLRSFIDTYTEYR